MDRQPHGRAGGDVSRRAFLRTTAAAAGALALAAPGAAAEPKSGALPTRVLVSTWNGAPPVGGEGQALLEGLGFRREVLDMVWDGL